MLIMRLCDYQFYFLIPPARLRHSAQSFSFELNRNTIRIMRLTIANFGITSTNNTFLINAILANALCNFDVKYFST